MAETLRQYTTKEKVNALVPTPIDDAILDNVINLITGYMDTFLGFKLGWLNSDSAIDWILDGSGTEYLMLDQPVLKDFTSLNYMAFDDSLSPEQYYALYPLNASYTTYIGKKMGVFKAGMGNYKLVGVKIGMFTIDWNDVGNHTLPNDITEVANSLCLAFINAGMQVASDSADTDGNKIQESIGDYSVQYASSKSEQERILNSVPTASAILAKYKVIQVA